MVLILIDTRLHLDCNEGTEEQTTVKGCARLETTSSRVRVLQIFASSFSLTYLPVADFFYFVVFGTLQTTIRDHPQLRKDIMIVSVGSTAVCSFLNDIPKVRLRHGVELPSLIDGCCQINIPAIYSQ
jgi:hypothetical protein